MPTRSFRAQVALVTSVVLVLAGGISSVAAERGSVDAEQRPGSSVTSATAASDGLFTVDLSDARFSDPAGPIPAVPPASGQMRADGASSPAVVTGTINAPGIRVVGLTWNSTAKTAGLTAWARTRSDGSWTDWFEVPGAEDHGPNPNDAEAAGVRGGTDPLIVAEADAVQVRVDTVGGVVPAGLRLDLVDPGEASGVDARSAGAAESAAPVAARRPAIRSRAQWGADESLRGPDLRYARVDGAFVHHTVSANGYGRAEVPAIIRGIYRYHVLSRGWNDIGYNFLVDRFGRIWEGRAGGVGRPVQGAHTAGYNDDAFGAAAIGTYTSKSAEPMMVEAYQRLIAWKFAVHHVDPRKPAVYDGTREAVIAGHRDAASTICPGDGLYRRLTTIRHGVRALMYGAVPSISWLPSGAGDRELVARRDTDGSLWRYRGAGRPRLIGTNWNSMSAMAAPRDVNGDRWPDVVARKASNGTLWFYAGRSDGHLNAPRRTGTSWQTMTTIVGAGDWTGDRRGDLIARRRSDGALWLYPGTGGGGNASPIRIGNNWKTMDLLTVPGDLNGNGRPDLLARKKSDGTLWLYPGRGKHGLGSPRRIGHGWRTIEMATGVGDLNGNGRADIVARRPNGTLWFYGGRPDGTFAPARRIGTGWQHMTPTLGMPR